MKKSSATLLAIALTATTSVLPALAQQSSASRPRITAEQFLQHYFAETIDRGNSGLNLWCSHMKGKESLFYAPRSWRLQGGEQDDAGGDFRVQVASSNRGGSPIVANWYILVSREKNPTRARQLYGGYCIEAIIERT